MKISRFAFCIMLPTASVLSGCQHSIAEPVPALLTNPSAATKQELQQQIQQLTDGPQVKLADNVFTTSHKLYIEQQVLVDERGLPLMGRHQQPVKIFSLLTDGSHCLLRHDASEQLVILQQVQCTAVAPH
ncbi:hypothetical protein QE250_10825 [Chromatiaceae bacterium AAb-1]|nr:hypothetical protein [Chromatiaceae bacterium AAb-1]